MEGGFVFPSKPFWGNTISMKCSWIKDEDERKNPLWEGTPLDCGGERFESWFFLIISHARAASINNSVYLRGRESRVDFINLGFDFPQGTLKFLFCLCPFSFPRSAQLWSSLHWGSPLLGGCGLLKLLESLSFIEVKEENKCENGDIIKKSNPLKKPPNFQSCSQSQ